MIAHCRERLADFKVPQYVALRSEPLPRNPGGKVLKGTCGTRPNGARRCAELSPSRAAVHRFAECPRAAARRTTLQA